MSCTRSFGGALGRVQNGQMICRPYVTVGKGKNKRVITAASRGKKAFCFMVGAGRGRRSKR